MSDPQITRGSDIAKYSNVPSIKIASSTRIYKRIYNLEKKYVISYLRFLFFDVLVVFDDVVVLFEVLVLLFG